MAAVQAYACASGKEKNLAGRRTLWRGGIKVLRLLVFKHIRNWSYAVCICHRTGRSVTKG